MASHSARHCSRMGALSAYLIGREMRRLSWAGVPQHSFSEGCPPNAGVAVAGPSD